MYLLCRLPLCDKVFITAVTNVKHTCSFYTFLASCFHTLKTAIADNTMAFEKSVVKLRQISARFYYRVICKTNTFCTTLQLETEVVLSRWIYLLWLKNFQASDSNERHSPGTQKLLVFVTRHIYYIHTLFTISALVEDKSKEGEGVLFFTPFF